MCGRGEQRPAPPGRGWPGLVLVSAEDLALSPVATPALSSGHQEPHSTEPCDEDTDTCETTPRSGGHTASCEAGCDDREAWCDDSLGRHVGSVTAE